MSDVSLAEHRARKCRVKGFRATERLDIAFRDIGVHADVSWVQMCEKVILTGSLAFCANTAKVDILLQRHLVWTADDESILQPSASQFSSPASLLIEHMNTNERDIQR